MDLRDEALDKAEATLKGWPPHLEAVISHESKGKRRENIRLEFLKI